MAIFIRFPLSGDCGDQDTVSEEGAQVGGFSAGIAVSGEASQSKNGVIAEKERAAYFPLHIYPGEPKFK